MNGGDEWNENKQTNGIESRFVMRREESMHLLLYTKVGIKGLINHVLA